ncbi:hypothetical protein KFL_017710010, partial [Klebsormidium nitens]
MMRAQRKSPNRGEPQAGEGKALGPAGGPTADGDEALGAGGAAAGAVFAYLDEVYKVRGAQTRRVGPVQNPRAALVPHVVEVDEAGRRALPPGWRYREGGNQVVHAGALSFDGRHWRGKEEWEIQDRADAHMALELQREWPQWVRFDGAVAETATPTAAGPERNSA